MVSEQDVTTPPKGRRDPQARKSAIISAAADLLMENGPAGLTHRAIAKRAGVSLGSTTQYFSSLDELRETALNHIAQEIDAELDEIAPLFVDVDSASTRAASIMVEFLNDPRQVQREIALINAGTTNPSMRDLAGLWFDRLVELLAEHIGQERATAIAVYLDGLTIHAALHRAPIDEAQVANTIRYLATMPITGATP